MGIRTNTIIDEKLQSLPVDSEDILTKLDKINYDNSEFIEIVSYLPARPDLDIITGYVRRWLDIQNYFNKKVRVFAWCYTPLVEKRIVQLTAEMSQLIVTALPINLKESANG